MPDGYVCYDPPEYAPPVSSLPAETAGCVTFGSFNNSAKITSQVIEVWAKILARVADSRLVLKYSGMNDSSVVGRVSEICAGHGVDADRLTFLGRSPHEQLLGEYQRIDLALDPFPYSGGLTTCEALWMGVPVITCPGETFASRHSLSHLSSVGLTETVVSDLPDYVELAVGLADDLPRLAKWRAELRERMAQSPLCDGRRFAGQLMHNLRTLWREWCRVS
jgi:predicted O-linked N-acetylglucosamine transferase (SPINDLY family)